MRRFTLGLVVALPATGAQVGLSQEPSESAAVFPSEANYVEVDVRVTDEQGDPVRGLTPDDFEILEEGAPQGIAAFTEVAIPIERIETAPGMLPPPDVATNEAGLEGRVYVLVMDEVHTHPRRSGMVREIATQFIEEHMAEGDVAAVVYDGRVEAGQTFTKDRRLLSEAVSRFAGRRERSATLVRTSIIDHQKDMLVSPGQKMDADPYGAQRAHAVRATMETLEAVARGLGELRGRRKSILYFSEGSDYDTVQPGSGPAEVRAALGAAIAAATRNNVAIYAIDPRGPVSTLGTEDIEMTAPYHARERGIDSQSLEREVRRSQDGLRFLAGETGGRAAVDTNDYGAAYERVVRESSHYYLLGYYPSEFRRDGAFRRIAVRVRRPDVEIAARDGYARPGPEDERDEDGPEPAAGAVADSSPQVRELLERSWPQPGLTLAVTAAPFEGAGGKARVVVTVEVPGEALPLEREGDYAANRLELSLLAIDQTGRVRGGDRLLAEPKLSAPNEERVRRSGLRFVRTLELPPGRYQLRVAAREDVRGTRGSVFDDLVVPDYGGDGLGLSGVLLTSRAAAAAPTSSAGGAVEVGLETPPTAARSFAAGDVLTAYAEVYGARGPDRDFDVTSRVTSADGREELRSIRRRAELAGTGDRLMHRVEIPLVELGPGSYVLQLEATPTSGGEPVSRELAFEVAGLAAGGVDDTAPSRPASPTPGAGSGSRIDRLEAWLGALEGHEPGTADERATLVRSWTPLELEELAQDVSVIVRLIGDPDHPVLWMFDPKVPRRLERGPYSTEDDERLRALARRAAGRCSAERDLPADAAERCARNRILKRGAILHTDAALRVANEAVRPRGGDAPRPKGWEVAFDDGQQRGAVGASGHWELARSLLDNVAPDPNGDDTVRLWYIATSAHTQYSQWYVRHEDRAVELFPQDPDLLFLAGSLHETLATARVQSLIRSVDLPGGASHGIGSASSELRKAEELFRRALEANPAFTEARIRLGRVAHLLGSHERAAGELERAVKSLESSVAAADGGLLLYYAELFRGAAAEALGRHEEAGASYARAAALFPEAPSPRLALSRLALRRHDRASALEALQALRPLPDRPVRGDPWLGYNLVQGRHAGTWFAELYASLGAEP